MTAPHHRGALEALNAARPAIARLGASQGPEDRAADLIEGWSAVETALRSLVGGSSHGGQALIRELRARQIITFDQGNALAEFHSAAERSRQSNYAPTDADINAARDAFLKLESGLMAAVSAEPGSSAYARATGMAGAPAGVSTGAPTGASTGASHGGTAPTVTAAPVIESAPGGNAARIFAPPRAPRWLRGVLIALALAAVLGLAFYAYRTYGAGSELDEAVALYSRGQRQEAAAAFERVARDNPRDARPHIYLARMAREAGNMTLARDEATKAVQADPQNPLAHGEMARYLMTTGTQWDLARQFWVRALSLNPDDKAAQGYLGCTLLRLGRTDEARTWLSRAGQGEWSACAQQVPPAGAYPTGQYPGQVPQGPYPPAGYPQQYPPGTVPRTQ